MKKYTICVVAMSIGTMVAHEKVKFFDRVKTKATHAWLSTKTTAAYVVSSMRESNAIKIQRALEAKEAVLKMRSFLQISMSSEEVLLQNIQALGLTKNNALSALTTIERYYADMSCVVNRYSSKVARWNKSDEMEVVAHNILFELQTCKLFKTYFEQHKNCLKIWEILARYESAVLGWQKNDRSCGCIKSMDLLKRDVEIIRSYAVKQVFRLVYPDTYQQLHEYLPILECKLDQMKF